MFTLIDIVALTIIAFIIPKTTRWLGIAGLSVLLFYQPFLGFLVTLLAAVLVAHYEEKH